MGTEIHFDPAHPTLFCTPPTAGDLLPPSNPHFISCLFLYVSLCVSLSLPVSVSLWDPVSPASADHRSMGRLWISKLTGERATCHLLPSISNSSVRRTLRKHYLGYYSFGDSHLVASNPTQSKTYHSTKLYMMLPPHSIWHTSHGSSPPSPPALTFPCHPGTCQACYNHMYPGSSLPMWNTLPQASVQWSLFLPFSFHSVSFT